MVKYHMNLIHTVLQIKQPVNSLEIWLIKFSFLNTSEITDVWQN